MDGYVFQSSCFPRKWSDSVKTERNLTAFKYEVSILLLSEEVV